LLKVFELFFEKENNEKKMQNNTLNCSKVLFCIELYTEDNSNRENKKVSNKSKQLKFWIEIPSEEFKTEFQIIAKRKRLTQKALTEKIFYEYLINKETNNRKMIKELENNIQKHMINVKKDTKQEVIKKINMVLVNHLNIMQNYDPDEVNNFVEHIESFTSKKNNSYQAGLKL